MSLRGSLHNEDESRGIHEPLVQHNNHHKRVDDARSASPRWLSRAPPPLLLSIINVAIGNTPALCLWVALSTANTIGFWFQLSDELRTAFFSCANMIPIASLPIIAPCAWFACRSLTLTLTLLRQQTSIDAIARYLEREHTCCRTILALTGSRFYGPPRPLRWWRLCCCCSRGFFTYRSLDAFSWPTPWKNPSPWTRLYGTVTSSGVDASNSAATAAPPPPSRSIALNLFNRPWMQYALVFMCTLSVCVAAPLTVLNSLLLNMRFQHGVINSCWDNSAYANNVWFMILPLVLYPGVLILWSLHNQFTLFKLHAMLRVPHSHLAWGRVNSMLPASQQRAHAPPYPTLASVYGGEEGIASTSNKGGSGGPPPPPPLLPWCLIPRVALEAEAAAAAAAAGVQGQTVPPLSTSTSAPAGVYGEASTSHAVRPALTWLEVQNIVTAEFLVDLRHDVTRINVAISPFVFFTTLPFGAYAFVASFQYIQNSDTSIAVYLAFVAAAWTAALAFPAAIWCHNWWIDVHLTHIAETPEVYFIFPGVATAPQQADNGSSSSSSKSISEKAVEEASTSAAASAYVRGGGGVGAGGSSSFNLGSTSSGSGGMGGAASSNSSRGGNRARVVVAAASPPDIVLIGGPQDSSSDWSPWGMNLSSWWLPPSLQQQAAGGAAAPGGSPAAPPPTATAVKAWFTALYTQSADAARVSIFDIRITSRNVLLALSPALITTIATAVTKLLTNWGK